MNEIKLNADGKVYQLTNQNNGNKYDRAKADAGSNAVSKQILAHYDKLAGYIQDENGNKINNGPFWEAEKARLADEINNLENKSNKELEAIIRRAENTNVPGSLFQRAKIELDLRDRKRRQEKPKSDNKWWEKTWVQIIMVLGAVAGIIGMFALL